MKRLLFVLAALLLLPVLSGCWQAAELPGQRLPATDSQSAGKQETLIPPQPGTESTSSQPMASDPVSAAEGALLTREDAQKAALEHAGFTTDQVTRLHTEADLDDRIPHYDVEFRQDGLEYEYEIHAYTGQVLTHEKERG